MRTDTELRWAFELVDLFYRDGAGLNYTATDRHTIACCAATLAWVLGKPHHEDFSSVLNALVQDRWKLGDFGNGALPPRG